VLVIVADKESMLNAACVLHAAMMCSHCRLESGVRKRIVYALFLVSAMFLITPRAMLRFASHDLSADPGTTLRHADRASNADVTTFFRTVVGLSENAARRISSDMLDKLAACNLEVKDIGLKDIKGKGCECMWEVSSRTDSTERDPLVLSFHSSLLKLPSVQQTSRRLSQSFSESPSQCSHAGLAAKYDSRIDGIWLEPLHGNMDISPSLETKVDLQLTCSGGADPSDHDQTQKRQPSISPHSRGRQSLIPIMRLRTKSSCKDGRRPSID